MHVQIYLMHTWLDKFALIFITMLEISRKTLNIVDLTSKLYFNYSSPDSRRVPSNAVTRDHINSLKDILSA